MRVAKLTSTSLHDPVLPLVRPVPVALKQRQTIAEAHAAVRAVPAARHVPYFYVLDDEERLAGVVKAGDLLVAQLDERVEQVMVPGVVAIPSWATRAHHERILRHAEVSRVPGDSRRRHAGGCGGQGCLHRRHHRGGARDLRRDLSAAGRARHRDGDAVDGVSRPLSLAALEHQRRPDVRLHRQPVRVDAAADRRAVAVHSDRARARRKRQHAVGHAHAAAPVERVAQAPADPPGAVARDPARRSCSG